MTSCADNNVLSQDNTTVKPVSFSNLFLRYAETSDSKFCSTDSIIPGDSGIFGVLYLTDKGNIIISPSCMTCDSGSIYSGKYNLTDSSIIYTLTDEFYYPNSQDENANSEDDYAKGKTRKHIIDPITLIKSKCNSNAYFIPFTAEEKKEAAKTWVDAIPQGIFYYPEKDREQYFLSKIKKIKVLANL